MLEHEEAQPAPTARAIDDPEALERLRALGYVGNPSVGAAPATGVRDPKYGDALRELLTKGDQLLRRRRFARRSGPSRRRSPWIPRDRMPRGAAWQ